MRTTCDLGAMSSKALLLVSKRKLIALSAFCLSLHSSRYFPALALGDTSVKIEDVTPKIFPSGPLFPTEKRIAELFETNTYSVVNIFDATLRPQLNVTGVVEIPEGNGSGVVTSGETGCTPGSQPPSVPVLKPGVPNRD
ncbi:protease Do-like 8, chloroplastic [Miscanthus floridulus]|uniref:protease Do-like 8, chloroplastic n=1 Tax=Miscanthus floridulus TaxID=154761 RepID=UPI00345ADD09